MSEFQPLITDQTAAAIPAGSRGAAPITLASVWPRPNFRDAALTGRVPVATSILYMVVYDNLRSAPAAGQSEDLGLSPDFWKTQYVRGVSFLRSAWELGEIASLSALGAALGGFMRSGCTNDAELKYATSAIAKGHIAPMRSPIELPPHLVMRQSSIAAMGWPADMDIPDTAKVGVVKVDASHPQHGYEHGYYPALALMGSNRLVPLKNEPSATRKTAIRAAVEEQLNLNYRNETRGGTPTLVFSRTGTDWRQGMQVKAAVLASMFEFKGMEFGKSITLGEQQSFMDALYDAAMDLCSIMRMPPAAASCFGRLGIAFGSQGKGAATGAATFDADTWQMHLTKTRGGGALCHEFGHAVDAMLLEVLFDDSKVPAQTQFVSDLMASHHDASGIYAISDALIPHLRSPYYKRVLLVIDDICENIFSRRRGDSYFCRSEEIDTQKGVIYWSQPRELFARAFETYALDKLTEQGTHNDFLVRHVDEYRRESEDFADSIFPQGFQRRELAGLFNRLFVELNGVDAWDMSER